MTISTSSRLSVYLLHSNVVHYHPGRNVWDSLFLWFTAHWSSSCESRDIEIGLKNLSRSSFSCPRLSNLNNPICFATDSIIDECQIVLPGLLSHRISMVWSVLSICFFSEASRRTHSDRTMDSWRIEMSERSYLYKTMVHLFSCQFSEIIPRFLDIEVDKCSLSILRDLVISSTSFEKNQNLEICWFTQNHDIS
jgi:hypothetical protein